MRAILVPALVVALLLPGCGAGAAADSVKEAELERQVADLYAPRRSGASAGADCAGDLQARMDSSRDCRVTVGARTAHVRVVVTDVGDDEVRFEATPFVPRARVARTVSRSLQRQGFRVERVQCADDLLGVQDGTTACTVAPGDVDELEVRVTRVDGLKVGFDVEGVGR